MKSCQNIQQARGACDVIVRSSWTWWIMNVKVLYANEKFFDMGVSVKDCQMTKRQKAFSIKRNIGLKAILFFLQDVLICLYSIVIDEPYPESCKFLALHICIWTTN